MLSLLARFLLPAHGNYRFVWTVGQMVIGGLVLLWAHLELLCVCSLENDRLTPLDIIARPFTIWITVGSSLPATFWRVALAIWGLAAFQFRALGGRIRKSRSDGLGRPPGTHQSGQGHQMPKPTNQSGTQRPARRHSKRGQRSRYLAPSKLHGEAASVDFGRLPDPRLRPGG